MPKPKYKYPFFHGRLRRNDYIGKLIAKGHQVRAASVHNIMIAPKDLADANDEQFFDTLHTVEDIDLRKGK